MEARQYKYLRRFQGSLKLFSVRKLVFNGLLEDPSIYLKHYITLSETYANQHEIYKHHLNDVKTRIRDNAAKGRTKFALYLAMNPELVPSPFVRCMHPLTRDIIRFRVGSHNLPVETGRWSRKDREDRVCEVCGVVGDEVHYLYNCTQVQRDDLNVLGDIRSIWEQPDIFKLIGRIKSLDIL